MIEQGFFFKIANMYHRSFVWRFFAALRSFPELETIPTDPWPGDVRTATSLLERYYSRVETGKFPFWSQLEVKDTPYFHTFEWLMDLKTMGDSRSRRFCRMLILSWIKTHKSSKRYGWEPSIAAKRLSNFLCYYEFFAQSADDRFLQIFHKTLFRHLEYLRFYALRLPASYENFLALKSTLMASIAFQLPEYKINQLLSKLYKTTEQILHNDGFSYKEHPDTQVRLTRHLIDMRNFLRQGHMQSEALKIQEFIERASPPIRLLRHGDGRLSELCGPTYMTASMIDVVLSLSDTRSRQPQASEFAGFERLSIDNALVLIKSKLPHKNALPSKDAMGALQFEWSIGKDRIFNLADIILEDSTGKRQQSLAQPNVHRRAEDDHRFIEFNLHDNHLTHHREIYLGQGNDLRVCDRLQVDQPSFGALRLLINQSFDVQIHNDHTKVTLHHRSGDTFHLTFKNIDEISVDHKDMSTKGTKSLYVLFQLLPGVEREISWAATKAA